MVGYDPSYTHLSLLTAVKSLFSDLYQLKKSKKVSPAMNCFSG